MTQLQGVLSAVATPFTADGESVDEGALRELVERTIAEGIHGLVPCGSTGEFPSLTTDERRRVVEVVIDQAAGRVPTIPHTGAMTTREAIALSAHAQESGAAGILAVAPFYEPLTLVETKGYFREVAAAIDVPVIVYNLPGATGVNLLPADVAELADTTENIRYVKDTTGDFSQAAKLIHDFGDRIGTFVGWDPLFLASVNEGAAGSIVGAANFIAPQLVEIFNDIRAGKVDDAKATWSKVFPLMQYLVSGPYVSGVKGTLDRLGYSAGPARAPLHPITSDRGAELDAILKALAAA